MSINLFDFSVRVIFHFFNKQSYFFQYALEHIVQSEDWGVFVCIGYIFFIFLSASSAIGGRNNSISGLLNATTSLEGLITSFTAE